MIHTRYALRLTLFTGGGGTRYEVKFVRGTYFLGLGPMPVPTENLEAECHVLESSGMSNIPEI